MMHAKMYSENDAREAQSTEGGRIQLEENRTESNGSEEPCVKKGIINVFEMLKVNKFVLS